MAPKPYAVPRYPIATVCELKSVLSASMHFTLVKLELNLHNCKHGNQPLVPTASLAAFHSARMRCAQELLDVFQQHCEADTSVRWACLKLLLGKCRARSRDARAAKDAGQCSSSVVAR